MNLRGKVNLVLGMFAKSEPLFPYICRSWRCGSGAVRNELGVKMRERHQAVSRGECPLMDGVCNRKNYLCRYALRWNHRIGVDIIIVQGLDYAFARNYYM